MAQQSSPAREWHSARVTTLSAVLPAVYGGPRRGMPRATQSAWSWWGNLPLERKRLPRVLVVLNASPGLK